MDIKLLEDLTKSLDDLIKDYKGNQNTTSNLKDFLDKLYETDKLQSLILTIIQDDRYKGKVFDAICNNVLGEFLDYAVQHFGEELTDELYRCDFIHIDDLNNPDTVRDHVENRVLRQVVLDYIKDNL